MSNILNKKQTGSKNQETVNNCHTVVEVTRLPDAIAKKYFASSEKGSNHDVPYIRVDTDGAVRIVCKAPDGSHLQEIHLHKVTR